jgi:hypothetical protein
MLNDVANSPNVKSYGLRRWLFVALLFVFVRALPSISYPIGRDHATYFVIGEDLLRGHRPYGDLWDNKPPGIVSRLLRKWGGGKALI